MPFFLFDKSRLKTNYEQIKNIEMKRTFTTILLLLTIINLFGQMPTMADNEESNKINYSNNQVLTLDDMVFNETFNPIKKIPLDINSILIYDYDGSLKSFNLKSKEINWSVKPSDADREMCGNKLTLKDGVVYVPFVNGEIYALDNQTGKLFWKSRLGNIKDEIVIKNQIPIINDGKLYITTQNKNSNIYALNLKNGDLIWNYKLAYPYNFIPVLFFDNKIFTQSAPYFYSFDAENGKALYQRGFKKAMYGKPVTDGENVFIANESDILFALSPDKLDILWEFQLDKNQYSIKERIFCKDKKIFFGTYGSSLSSVYSLNSKTGDKIWKTDFKDDGIEYIMEQNNTLWGYTKKGILFQLSLNDGKIMFEKQLTSLPISNIEFQDKNSIYYFCEAGLIQFDLKSKEEELIYIRGSINDDATNAFIKIIR